MTWTAFPGEVRASEKSKHYHPAAVLYVFCHYTKKASVPSIPGAEGRLGQHKEEEGVILCFMSGSMAYHG